VHDFVVDPLDAVMVAVSPVDPPDTENVGVVSEVTLSELDEPVSDADARPGAAGAAGAEVSLVTVFPLVSAPGPVTPDPSVTVPASKRGVMVPSEHEETVNVNDVADPDDGAVEKRQPVEPPALLKSVPETVAASTADEKVTV